MKHYAVTTGEYSDYQIVAIFSDFEKASLFCAVNNRAQDDCRYPSGYYNIEEYEDPKATIECGKSELRYIYEFNVQDMTKTEEEVFKHFSVDQIGITFSDSPHAVSGICMYDPFAAGRIIVALDKPDNSEALRVARDLWAKYQEENK